MTNKNIFNDLIPLLLFAIFLACGLAPYYTGGSLILGGEGDFVINFAPRLAKYGFAWFSAYGLGTPNLSPSGTGFSQIVLVLVEKMTHSPQITNFVLIFSIYYLPFLSMFLAGRALKVSSWVSFAVAAFYIVNPFMLNYFACLNQWNVFSVAAMPLFLFIIVRYYNHLLKLFFIFGTASLILSYANTNHPMAAIIQVSIIISVFVAERYYSLSFSFFRIISRYALLIFSFILFNLWWILPLFISIPDAQRIYTAANADTWLSTTVHNEGPIFARALLLFLGIGTRSDYNFVWFWNNLFFSKIICTIPILIIVYGTLIEKNKNTRLQKLCISMLSLLLGVLFLVKGSAAPFGGVYIFLMHYVPFFYIMKSPIEKFGLLYMFIFAVLLLLIFLKIRDTKSYKAIVSCFIYYLIFCSVPVISGHIIPDSRLSDHESMSRKYKEKGSYGKFRESINSDLSQYKILSLPGNGNYQMCFKTYVAGKYYTGMDPLLHNVDKPFLAVEGGNHWLFEEIGTDDYLNLLKLYNIGKIVINEDSVPWFGFVGESDPAKLKNFFSRSMHSKKFGAITVFKNEKYFLPNFYTASAGE